MTSDGILLRGNGKERKEKGERRKEKGERRKEAFEVCGELRFVMRWEECVLFIYFHIYCVHERRCYLKWEVMKDGRWVLVIYFHIYCVHEMWWEDLSSNEGHLPKKRHENNEQKSKSLFSQERIVRFSPWKVSFAYLDFIWSPQFRCLELPRFHVWKTRKTGGFFHPFINSLDYHGSCRFGNGNRVDKCTSRAMAK